MIGTTFILGASQAAEAASTDSSLLAPAIVAAIVSAAVALMTFMLAGRRARLDRQRQLFAEAFEAVMEYREYPHIVRRRSPEEPAAERRRISGDLSRVQAKLNSYSARLLVEAPEVGKRYEELVAKTREIVGAKIREAWENEPVAADEKIHAPPYDLSRLDTPNNAYLQAVKHHLDWNPW